MRVAIDCYELVKGHGKSIGIYNYSKNLLDELSKKLSDKHEVIIFANKFNKVDFEYENVNTVIIQRSPLKTSNKVIWEMLLINTYIKKYNIDVLFSPRGYVPPINSCKTCITVHDLIPFYYYENYKDSIKYLENLYIRFRLKQSVLKSDKIITISQYSKNDIIKRFNIKHNNITVIHNGIKKKLKKHNQAIKICDNYIFAISSDLPHKNYIGLLKSYAIYYKNSKHPLKLVVCGVKKYRDFSNLIEKNIFENILHLEYISDEELQNYYEKCSFFVFLSKIEGFGFPPLEALMYNKNVICSNTSCFTEVLGDSVVYVNPDDYREISKEMINVENNIYNIDNSYKEAIIKKYDWESCANEVFNVLNTFLSEDK
ncbi:glycosyltransferase family 1 protein [Clostridium sp. BSD9I1]|uniref:glycosyltransferase family 4 protein n=1 Tax=Clostridium sp. BSD9I1 TaxID=2003589 RepID=UPI0016453470|nr:glycosyltransferase family 1 protein [Clostridium sp. BSD9I1]